MALQKGVEGANGVETLDLCGESRGESPIQDDKAVILPVSDLEEHHNIGLHCGDLHQPSTVSSRMSLEEVVLHMMS